MAIREKTPLSVIIFGATGDLALHKLFPSLFRLFKQQTLPDTFNILGVSRRAWKDEDMRAHIRPTLVALFPTYEALIDSFLGHVHHHEALLQNATHYIELGAKLERLDKDARYEANKLFYIALAPEFYADVFKNIGMVWRGIKNVRSWQRILVEKPFGVDLKSAKALYTTLRSFAEEDDIYLVDHYLQKPIIKNLHNLRANNPFLQKQFQSPNLASIDIILHEKKDIGKRAHFYDNTGVMRDVVQNHMMSMFAMTVLDIPQTDKAKALRDARAGAISSLVPLSSKHWSIRGQYDGYDEDSHVQGSITETYVGFETTSRLPSMKGVTLHFSAGKALDESRVEIALKSKHDKDSAFVFRIQPDPFFGLSFNNVGNTSIIKNMTYKDDMHIREAHDSLFEDVMSGDQSFFLGIKEVEASWKFIDGAKEVIAGEPLRRYTKGSSHPS